MKYSESSHVGALEIDKNNEDFCTNCYYLIRLIPMSDSSLDLIVFPEDTPIQVRYNRVINDRIHIGDSKRVYRYHSTKTFYISVDIGLGEADIKIVRKVDNKLMYTQRTRVSQLITVAATSSLA